MSKVIIKVPFYLELEGEGLSQKDLIKGFHQREDGLWKILQSGNPIHHFLMMNSNSEVSVRLIFGIKNLKNRIT